MRRVLVAVPPLLLLLSAGVAQADSGPAPEPVVVSATSGTLFPGCQDVPVTYSAPVDPGATDWDLEVDITDSDDYDLDTPDIGSDYSSPAQGSFTVQVCDDEEYPGVFTIAGDGEETVGDETRAFTVTPATFTLAADPARASLAAKRHGHHYVMAVQVQAQGRDGTFGAYARAAFTLQALKAGTWKPVPHGFAKAGVNGVGKLAVYPTRKTTYRVVVDTDDTHDAATSDPVTLRKPRP